jgi:hypothetical protein
MRITDIGPWRSRPDLNKPTAPCGGKTRRDETCNDRERAPADPEKLVEFVLDGNGAASEIAMKCLVQLFGICVERIALREMDGDPDRTLVRQFARPTDDVFFGIG